MEITIRQSKHVTTLELDISLKNGGFIQWEHGRQK